MDGGGSTFTQHAWDGEVAPDNVWGCRKCWHSSPVPRSRILALFIQASLPIPRVHEHGDRMRGQILFQVREIKVLSIGIIVELFIVVTQSGAPGTVILTRTLHGVPLIL